LANSPQGLAIFGDDLPGDRECLTDFAFGRLNVFANGFIVERLNQLYRL